MKNNVKKKAKDLKASGKSEEKKKTLVSQKEVKPEKAETAVTDPNFPSLQELLEAGAHFGHSVKRRNPKMDEYIYATKNGVQVFDLVKTRKLLAEACEYLERVMAKGGEVVVLGTKGQATEVIREESTRVGNAFVVNRWVGGLFTNWEEIKKQIDKLTEMRTKMEVDEYKIYTKKEQVLLKREIDRLDRMYGGLVRLKKLPDVLFVIDSLREDTAIREAIACKIPIVAVCDSNSDPTGIDKIIPANDDSLKTVKILVKAVITAIERGMKRKAQENKE